MMLKRDRSIQIVDQAVSQRHYGGSSSQFYPNGGSSATLLRSIPGPPPVVVRPKVKWPVQSATNYSISAPSMGVSSSWSSPFGGGAI